LCLCVVFSCFFSQVYILTGFFFFSVHT
jgi:hypothetical protein